MCVQLNLARRTPSSNKHRAEILRNKDCYSKLSLQKSENSREKILVNIEIRFLLHKMPKIIWDF